MFLVYMDINFLVNKVFGSDLVWRAITVCVVFVSIMAQKQLLGSLTLLDRNNFVKQSYYFVFIIKFK